MTWSLNLKNADKVNYYKVTKVLYLSGTLFEMLVAKTSRCLCLTLATSTAERLTAKK